MLGFASHSQGIALEVVEGIFCMQTVDVFLYMRGTGVELLRDTKVSY
jgi:hypothetical protein